MFSIPSIIKMLQVVGPITAALPQFKEVYDDIVKTFKSDTDQKTLQTAYQELQAGNSGGHVRLQEMLRQAEKE
jgi:hypothetical protein